VSGIRWELAIENLDTGRADLNGRLEDVGFVEVFEFLSKDTEAPARASVWWFRTREPNEVSFVTAVKFRFVVSVRIFPFNRLDPVAFVEFFACSPCG